MRNRRKGWSFLPLERRSLKGQHFLLSLHHEQINQDSGLDRISIVWILTD
ncbi:hypothetical protein LINGRAHAP2_LOCUS12096 [Linum grandiflorum]